MKSLRMMSSVWGDGHIGWMERALVRSLCWPKNKQALNDATWDFFCKKSEEEKIRPIVEKVGVKKIEFHPLPESLHGTPRQMGLILLDALLIVMKECLKTDSQLLMAPPDSFFSDGSIPNLIKLGRFGHTCIAVPHARVSPSIFGSITNDTPLSGAELTSRLKKFPHRSWSSSEIGTPEQSSYIGGIAWQALDDKTISVQHMLPTIYLANFVPDDVIFFQTSHDGSEPVFGAWDHLWPMKLIKEQRQRTPGSSDIACILEVTKDDQNVPAKVPVNPYEPDAFWRGAPHNHHNRQICFTMRSE